MTKKVNKNIVKSPSKYPFNKLYININTVNFLSLIYGLYTRTLNLYQVSLLFLHKYKLSSYPHSLWMQVNFTESLKNKIDILTYNLLHHIIALITYI